MRVFCTNCGKQLRQDMKICPFCGKVVRQPVRQGTQGKQRQQVRQSQRQGQTQRMQQRQQHPANGGQRPVRQQRPVTQVRPQPEPEVMEYIEESKPVKRHLLPAPVMRKIYRALTVAVVVTALYISIFMIQVFRVKTAVYPFKTNMKLTYSSYGQAFDAYFDEESWRVNPFNGNCTYKGKSNHGEEYEIVFAVKRRIKVKSITIDGKEIKKSIFEEKLMGMFI